jgi:acetolactate decarboxylase
MKRTSAILTAILLAFLALHLSYAEPPTLYQVSTISALKEGRYHGPTTFDTLKRHGDFGLGTLNALDGEMIAVDGRFFQIPADGTVHEIAASAQTPFAVVCFFKAERKLPVGEHQDLSRLLQWLDEAAPDQEKFVAIRIDGTFPGMKVRSVPRQDKPYPTLGDALKRQTVFDLTNTEGTLVGFRCPSSTGGAAVAGYHFHFINRERTAGGHVLDCRIKQAEAGILNLDQLLLQLSSDPSPPKLRVAPGPRNVVHE